MELECMCCSKKSKKSLRPFLFPHSRIAASRDLWNGTERNGRNMLGCSGLK
jgi:hypothetical protein